MRKIFIIILPILFTAQGCNFFNLSGDQASGPRGVFLSTDQGETWEEANTVAPNKSLSGTPVVKIFIEQGRTNNLLAAAVTGGLVGTDNRGKNWVPLLPTVSAYDSFINPSNSQEIFVGGSKGGLAAVLKSTDRGVTWTQIYSEPTGQAFVTSLAHDPRSVRVIYAGLSNGTFLKSLDSGTTWDSLVDHNDRLDKIIIVGNSIYVLGRTRGLKRSNDGGTSWIELGFTKDAPSQFNDFGVDPNNPATIYVATQAGLFRSQESGANWQKVALPASPEVNNISAVTVNPKNSRQIYAAISATVYRSDDRGVTWRTVSLPTRRTIATIVIDPEEPNRVYAGLK